jgi:ABC-2 type transport system ATP-binding protein
MSANEEAPLVALDALTVRYGRLLAVDCVSLEVARGEVYTLLGRNGAGKSSLVRCLLGEQKPTLGTATLLGENVWRKRERLMSRVGVVPEEPDMPPEMTAEQLLAFCSRLYPSWDGGSARERLRRFDIPTTTPAARLSKGQRGQLALALALAPRPELLVLDDPTLGLDAVARREFWEELIGELADHGTTAFLTTHDLGGVEGVAVRVGILKAGRLVMNDGLEVLKNRFRRICFGRSPAASAAADEQLVSLGALKVVGREWGFEAVVSAYDDHGFGRFRAAAGVLDASVEPMSLEDIFIATVDSPKEVRP